MCFFPENFSVEREKCCEICSIFCLVCYFLIVKSKAQRIRGLYWNFQVFVKLSESNINSSISAAKKDEIQVKKLAFGVVFEF
jgi:hypothetical protein